MDKCAIDLVHKAVAGDGDVKTDEGPGGEHAELLERMKKALGGEVKDEHRNIMTPQTVEHYRQRILDFSRRRMSKRA